MGTAFIGLAGPAGAVVERNFNSYDRGTFKQVTAQQALELLRRTLQRAAGIRRRCAGSVDGVIVAFGGGPSATGALIVQTIVQQVCFH